MGYTFSFVDDAVYSAQDINNITKRLVTSGIEDSFEDGVPYNAGRLNNLTFPLATEGVVPEDNTTMKVVFLEEGKIKIMPGLAFMESGATITIDEEGVILDYSTTEDNYVYIEDNESLGKIIPKVSSSLPTGYSYVLLATVTKSGEITDKRTFAKGKLPGYMSDFNTPKTFSVSVRGDGEYEVDIGRSECNFIMIKETSLKLAASGYDGIGLWSAYDKKYISTTCYNKGVDVSNECFYLTPYYTGTRYLNRVTMSFEGTVLKLNVVNEVMPHAVINTFFEITVV